MSVVNRDPQQTLEPRDRCCCPKPPALPEASSWPWREHLKAWGGSAGLVGLWAAAVMGLSGEMAGEPAFWLAVAVATLGCGAISGQVHGPLWSDASSRRWVFWTIEWALFLAIAGLILSSLFRQLPDWMQLPSWGVDWGGLREALALSCAFAGGGFFSRLQTATTAMESRQKTPQERHLEANREYCSYHREEYLISPADVIERSPTQLKVQRIDANNLHSCWCLRTGQEVHDYSLATEEPWRIYAISCPHCGEVSCLEHFHDDLWRCFHGQCRKNIGDLVRICDLCPPGWEHFLDQDAGRPLLCPHCKAWKACFEHLEQEGFVCGFCDADLEGLARLYQKQP